MLRVDDEVRISGTASSPSGLRVERMRCTVATVDYDAVKVWPLDAHDPQVQGVEKMWFPLTGIEVEILSSDDIDYFPALG